MEEWRDVEGYEGRYMVSNLGRVKSMERTYELGQGHFATQSLSTHIMACCVSARDNLCQTQFTTAGRRPPGRRYSVSRLVYAAFVGPIPEGYVIRVDGGDPADCWVGNLRAMSRAELMAENQRG